MIKKTTAVKAAVLTILAGAGIVAAVIFLTPRSLLKPPVNDTPDISDISDTLNISQEEPGSPLPSQTAPGVQMDARAFKQSPSNEYQYFVKDKYMYQTLNTKEQELYLEILTAIMSHEPERTIKTTDAETIDRVYSMVKADFGKIFWVSGYRYTEYMSDEKSWIVFKPVFTMNKEERTECQTKIDEGTEEIVKGYSGRESDYEKAKYVYNYLTRNIRYNAGAEDGQTIAGAFLNKETVCAGYAYAFQYLLEKFKIQSAVITGEADETSHAWNIARLDEEYYYFDVTWDATTFSREAPQDFVYNYFAVTADELRKTHIPEEKYILPECAATENNYFYREGLYFDTLDIDAMGRRIAQVYEGKALPERNLAFKFSGRGLMDEAARYLFDEQKITDYCKNISEIQYAKNNEMNILTICFD